VKSKIAIITVELVDESMTADDRMIKTDLLEWLQENVNLIPWAKDTTDITVKDP